MILTPLLKLPKNVEDLGKLIVSKGLKKLPIVKRIATSGHSGRNVTNTKIAWLVFKTKNVFTLLSRVSFLHSSIR